MTLGVLGLFALGSFLPSLTKDTTSDAFIPVDNPARVYREEVKERFGLSDPIVIAVSNPGEQGVFEPDTLKLVDWLTRAMQDVPNIDPERVYSLATENNIEGTEDGMIVTAFYDPFPESLEQAQAIWTAIQDFPLYLGSMVADDGKGTLVIAEVLNEFDTEATYTQIVDIVARAPIPDGVELHVAGEAAVVGYLGRYIDADARRLNPMAGITIMIILFVAFRTLRGALVPGIVIAAAVLGALGLMVAFGVPFFVITNAITVVLIGIAVADSVHVFTQYYKEIADDPAIDRQDAITRAMVEMWRPITLTTLTTMAGFMGLYLAATMPPLKYFGLFAAAGVGFAWLYSITVMPALMMYLKPKPSPAYQAGSPTGDVFARMMTIMGSWVLTHSRLTIGICTVGIVLGALAASQVRIDQNSITNFHPDEPIVKADNFVNEHFDGTTVMDIVVETEEVEGLFNPHYLRKIEAFQTFMEAHEGVGGTTSIVDYLKQMNRSINEGDKAQYALVDDATTNAQLFLVYSASGDPTDFEEEIDYDYQRANIRVNLTSGWYSDNAPLVEAFQNYVDSEFNEPGLKATLSGRAMVNDAWIGTIEGSHFRSVGIALVLILGMAIIVFRSFVAGILTLIPVMGAILFVYGYLVVNDIAIGVGASMFASVAIGLGVDFAIHTIDRMRQACALNPDVDQALASLYPHTGRALLFNLLAISLGFGVLLLSKVVPLSLFGMIVGLAVLTSFILSLTLLPALIKELKPRFIHGLANGKTTRRTQNTVAAVIAALLVGGSLTQDARAESMEAVAELSGKEIMVRVDERPEGEWVTRRLRMELTDRGGRQRTRDTIGYRRYYGAERRTVLFYTEPANLKNTAFLTWDYPEADKDDDQWLYLPAVRKIRRISASNRGDYFLGTDFTFEDIKREGKGYRHDFTHERTGVSEVRGTPCIVIDGQPRTEAIGRELGYSRSLSCVDPATWMILTTELWDIRGNRLKTIRLDRIEEIDGIWTATIIHIQNHKTGHQTRFIFSDVDYKAPVDDKWFETRRLTRGH